MSSYTTIDTATRKTQAIDLALYLGPTWAAYDYGEGKGYDRPIWRLRREDGLELSLDWPECWKAREGHRLSIGPVWPVDGRNQSCKPYDAPDLSISVAQTKPAKQIAAEIQRRLLAPWEPYRALALERQHNANSYADLTERTRQAVLAQEGAHGAHAGHHGEGLFLRHSHAYGISAQGDSIRFEAFSCPAAVGLQVLALLREKGGDDDA